MSVPGSPETSNRNWASKILIWKFCSFCYSKGQKSFSLLCNSRCNFCSCQKDQRQKERLLRSLLRAGLFRTVEAFSRWLFRHGFSTLNAWKCFCAFSLALSTFDLASGTLSKAKSQNKTGERKQQSFTLGIHSSFMRSFIPTLSWIFVQNFWWIQNSFKGVSHKPDLKVF